MTTVATIRAGLAANLATISGLRTSATIPDAPTPPHAVVIPTGIQFDRTFKRGLDEYNFTITVVASRADARSGQTVLDGFCNPTGAGSIKTAIESDRTLAGAAQSLHVKEMSAYGSTSIGDTMYLTADFTIVVYA